MKSVYAFPGAFECPAKKYDSPRFSWTTTRPFVYKDLTERILRRSLHKGLDLKQEEYGNETKPASTPLSLSFERCLEHNFQDEEVNSKARNLNLSQSFV